MSDSSNVVAPTDSEADRASKAKVISLFEFVRALESAKQPLRRNLNQQPMPEAQIAWRDLPRSSDELRAETIRIAQQLRNAWFPQPVLAPAQESLL